MLDCSRLTRRAALRGSALVGLTATFFPASGRTEATAADGFRYEIERSEAEWRELLSEDEYAILREGETEWPTTSPMWNDYSEGAYDCRGCALNLYQSAYRAPVEQGWVFFYHSLPNAVLTDIDTGNPYARAETVRQALIEVHCRRCGSHLGHIVYVEAQLVHCINGTSLTFRPADV